MKTLGFDYDFYMVDQLKKQLRENHKILKERGLDDSEIKIWKSVSSRDGKNSYDVKYPNIETSVELRKLGNDDEIRIEFALKKQRAMKTDYVPDIIFVEKNTEYKRMNNLEKEYKKLK